MNYLLESSLCLLISYLFYQVCLRRLTFFAWNRFALLLLLMASVLIPFFSFSITDISAVADAGNNFAWLANSQETYRQVQLDVIQWEWSTVFYLIYFIAVATMTIRLFAQLFRLAKLIRTAEQIPFNKATLLVNPSWVASSFFSYILLPNYEPENPDQQQVIQHELAHVGAFHSVDVLLLQVLKILFWFHPIIYLFERQLKAVHEFQVDQRLTQTSSSIEYSRLLLRLVQQKHSVSILNNFNYLQLKTRIMMLNNPSSKKSLKLRFLLVIPLFVLMLSLFAFEADQKEALVGTWKGTEFKFNQTKGGEFPKLISWGSFLHVNGELILNENNSCVFNDSEGNTNGQGTWRSETTNSFTVVDMEGNKTVYTVSVLEANKLVITHQVAMETPQGEIAGEIVLTYTR